MVQEKISASTLEAKGTVKKRDQNVECRIENVEENHTRCFANVRI